MERLDRSEQIRVAALEFVGQINRGANPASTTNFKRLLEQVKQVENYITWGRTP